MNAAQRQVAIDLWTTPIGLNHKLAFRLLVELHSLLPLLLLNPKAHTHFTIPQRIEG